MKLEYASVSLGRRKNKIKFFFLFKKTILLDACDLTAVDHYTFEFYFDRIDVGADKNNRRRLPSRALRKYISFCDDIFHIVPVSFLEIEDVYFQFVITRINQETNAL